jgi:hypothetical protein
LIESIPVTWQFPPKFNGDAGRDEAHGAGMAKDPWAMWHRGGRHSSLVEGTIVPKAFLSAIGHVVVAFSRLDSQLDLTIAFLLVDARRELGTAIASAIPNYRPRIELFERIIDFKIEDADDNKKLHKLAKEISVVADERHRLIHDYMSSLSFGSVSPVEHRLNLSRKESIFRKQKPTEVTKRSLEDLAIRMTDLSFRLQRFTKNDLLWKKGAQFPWRDRSRKRSPARSSRT